MTDVKPLFCRQGNKFPLRDKIVPLIPEHKTYVELFSGSGAIFFNKPRAERNVLNDLDKFTIDGFKLLKTAPTDVKKYPVIPQTVEAHRNWFDHHGNTPADKIMFHHMRSCEGFSGSFSSRSGHIYKPLNFLTKVERIPEFKELLKGVILENADYEDIIKKYDSPSTFFFIDPPYDKTSASSFGYAQGNEFDFERLADVLGGVKGNFILTLNDSKRFRNLFKGYTVKGITIDTNWQQKAKDGHRTKRKELIIMNY